MGFCLFVCFTVVFKGNVAVFHGHLINPICCKHTGLRSKVMSVPVHTDLSGGSNHVTQLTASSDVLPSSSQAGQTLHSPPFAGKDHWTQNSQKSLGQLLHKRKHSFIESQNSWAGRNPKDHLVPTLLSQAGPPTSRSGTRSGCPGPHPTWAWTPPGMEHPQPLWSACATTSPHSE